MAAYDKTAGAMAFFDPSRADDFLFISGTKVWLIPFFQALYEIAHLWARFLPGAVNLSSAVVDVCAAVSLS